MALRVLVVDDLDEMRALIRRALASDGCEVDEAATLAEAWQAGPQHYDALVVDAHLRQENGIELIEALRAQDPAWVGRCLVITGGQVDALPADVASLAKPFRIDDLRRAVRALQQPGEAAARLAPPRPSPPATPRPATPRPATPGPAGVQTQDVLLLSRMVRAREHRGLADYLHDGPIQELTAACLELQMLRPAAAASQASHLDAALTRVTTASAALRSLVDHQWPPPPPEGADLAEMIEQRTGWLLNGSQAAPVTVHGFDGGSPAAAEADLVADVAELMLLAAESAAPTASMRVIVQKDRGATQVGVRLTPGPGDRIGDLTCARARLGGLATVLGVSVQMDFSDREWQLTLTLAGV